MKCFAAVALALAASLAAQTPAPRPGTGTPPGPAGRDRDAARVDERAQSMREQIGEGKAVQSHVRVTVRLKNGNRLVGVVKDGRLVERVDGLRFVDANATDRGAGVRLWYTGGKRNYVFVPFLDFGDYEVLQRLSNKQIEAIEQDLQMAERAAAEREAAAARAAQAAEVAPPAPGGEGATAGDAGSAAEKVAAGKGANARAGADGGPVDPAKVQQLQQRTWFALVQEFPPAGGWNRQRRDEIARRKAVVGVLPSAAELRFVEMFEQWQKACAHFDLSTEPKPAPGADADGAGRRSRRGR